MFFILSKVFWPLIQPIYHIGFAILITPILLCFNAQRVAFWLSVYGAFLFIVFAVMPTAHNMLVYLERQYQTPEFKSDFQPDGIIVLGGSFDEELTFIHGQSVASGALDRMTHFLSLAKRFQNSPTKLVFSGGSARPLQSAEDNIAPDREFTDADAALLFFKEQGIEAGRIIIEGRSRTTYENVLFSRELLTPKDNETWIVVTSAWHLPRVMNVFVGQEWNVIPYPVDYQTDLTYRWMPNFNILKNLNFTQMAMHEYVGNAMYYITNKSASFLP